MNKFVLVVEFDVKPECLDEFNRLIDINAHASVANEAGCYQFDVVRGMEDPSKILLYEVYASEEALRCTWAGPIPRLFWLRPSP